MTELINTWQRFAEVTIKTNDLDPMYSVIAGLNQYHSRDWMGRYIMYFLLFYDPEGAYHVAEMGSDKDFWEVVKLNSQTKEVKRGTERRHFRGVNALRAVTTFQSMGRTAWDTLRDMYDGDALNPPTYTQFYWRMVNRYTGTQFGPYFIWKLYDIFNVCLGMPITLSYHEAAKYMPDEPRKAATVIFGTFGEGLMEVNEYIAQFDHPVREGKCGLAEAETILCMLKGAYLTKTHAVGDDIEEKWVQLAKLPELQRLLPKNVPLEDYALGTLHISSVHA